MRTATSEMLRSDLRRIRAQSLAAAIFDKMRHHIPDRHWREAHGELLDLLTAEGVEVLTDYTREEAGLPARGPDGWTTAELVALENRRLELLTAPLTLGPSART